MKILLFKNNNAQKFGGSVFLELNNNYTYLINCKYSYNVTL
jgi:hypothetical protein